MRLICGEKASTELIRDNEKTLFVVSDGNGNANLKLSSPAPEESILGVVPPMAADALGSADFQRTFGLTKSYSGGAMAGGISSVALVSAAANAGGIGFFGAGGLSPIKVGEALDDIANRLGSKKFGCNLLHSPTDPESEFVTAQICLDKGVAALEAAAFLKVTDAVVYFRAKGIRRRVDGSLETKHHIFAKVSRSEVASKFLAPPQETILRRLVAAQKISESEATMAAHLPVATAITAEADSGGHTDQRPLTVLLPMVLEAREQARRTFGWNESDTPIFIGAAGGLGDPQSFIAAFSMGADFVSTGSLNQSCLESGTSDMVKELLCKASMADVAMAPSADLFELGGRVQVLKRGTMFPQRAQKLFEAWRSADRFEDLSEEDREKIERGIFRQSFQSQWNATREYWQVRNPEIIHRATVDEKFRMALTFRTYLGQSSRWARFGDEARKSDFQIWCGPAIGAFNRWAEGSWLSAPEARSFPLVLEALFASSASLARRNILAAFGLQGVPSATAVSRPPERSSLLGA